MGFKKIKRLIRIAEESNISELEDNWGWWIFKKGVKIKRDVSYKLQSQRIDVEKEQPMERPSEQTAVEQISPESAPIEQAPFLSEEDNYVPIKSPMIGYFYRTPAIDAKPYVELNQQISPGDVVCIIRSMKINNEITSELEGIVRKVCVENAKPVEFGQILYLIEPVIKEQEK